MLMSSVPKKKRGIHSPHAYLSTLQNNVIAQGCFLKTYTTAHLPKCNSISVCVLLFFATAFKWESFEERFQAKGLNTGPRLAHLLFISLRIIINALFVH